MSIALAWQDWKHGIGLDLTRVCVKSVCKVEATTVAKKVWFDTHARSRSVHIYGWSNKMKSKFRKLNEEEVSCRARAKGHAKKRIPSGRKG